MKTPLPLILLAASIIVAFVFLFGSSALTQQPASTLPLSIPFHAASGSKAAFSVTVKRFRNYHINLVVAFADSERQRVRQIVGEPSHICSQLNNCGEISSFRVVVKSGTDVLFDEVRSVYGHYAHGTNDFWRRIAAIQLRPGTYDFEVTTIRFSPDLALFRTQLLFNTDAREADLEG